MYKRKKLLKVLVPTFILIAAVSIFSASYFIINGNFDIRFDAASSSLRAYFLNNNQNSIDLTQLDTYRIKVTNNYGTQLKGPYLNTATYCPPGVTRPSSGVQFVNLSTFQLHARIGKCVSYQVDFTPWSNSDGTITADLGKLAVDWRPTDIGTYYMKFSEKSNPTAYSNEIKLTINKLNMLDYWKMDPNDYYIFSGTNHVTNQSGKLYIDYQAKQKVCSDELSDSVVWRAYGSNKYMWWNPSYKNDSSVVYDTAQVKPGTLGTSASNANLYLAQTMTRSSYNATAISSTPLDQQYMAFSTWTNYPTDAALTNSVYNEVQNGQNLTANLKKFDSAASANRTYGNPSVTYADTVSNIKDANNTSLGNGTNLIYMPIMLDMNDEFNTDNTDFFTITSTDTNGCAKLTKKTAVSNPSSTTHSISFIPFKNNTYGYGIVVSLKEAYKNPGYAKCKQGRNSNGTYTYNAQNLKAGDCPAVLREDYYVNKGVGLTGMKVGQFGNTHINNAPTFTECKLDPDCLSSIQKGYYPTKKNEIKNPKFSMTLAKYGSKTTSTSNNQLRVLNSTTTSNSNLATSTRTVVNTNTAKFKVTLNTTPLDLSDLEYVQIVVDEKGGYAPVCGTSSFSSSTNGGIRLMFNNKSWQLGSNKLSVTGYQSNLYYYNPSKIAYSSSGYNTSTNAQNSYGWVLSPKGQTSLNLTNKFKVTNLSYTLVNGVWTVSFDASSPVNVNNLNTYIAFRKTSKTTGNQLSYVHDLNVADCRGDLFNKILY